MVFRFVSATTCLASNPLGLRTIAVVLSRRGSIVNRGKTLIFQSILDDRAGRARRVKERGSPVNDFHLEGACIITTFAISDYELRGSFSFLPHPNMVIFKGERTGAVGALTDFLALTALRGT